MLFKPYMVSLIPLQNQSDFTNAIMVVSNMLSLWFISLCLCTNCSQLVCKNVIFNLSASEMLLNIYASTIRFASNTTLRQTGQWNCEIVRGTLSTSRHIFYQLLGVYTCRLMVQTPELIQMRECALLIGKTNNFNHLTAIRIEVICR